MSPEAITRAIDLDDDGVMQQAVEQRGGDDGAAEDFTPFGKASVRGEDHRPFFIARIDQLEEQIATTGYDREVTDLVDDQQRWPAVEADPLAQRALPFGLGKRTDQVRKRDERDAFAGFDGFQTECAGKVALAGARRPQQVDDLAARDEVQFGKRQDAGVEGGDKPGQWNASDLLSVAV